MKIAVLGAAGRMGQALTRVLAETPGCTIAGGIEAKGSPAIGRDIGELAGLEPLGVAITDDPLPVFAHVDGVLDFTTPASTIGFAALAAQSRIVHVIGTTGLSPADEAKIEYLKPEGMFNVPSFSQVTTAEDGTLVFVSGQVAWDSQGKPVPGDLEAQTRLTYENLKRALAAAGATFISCGMMVRIMCAFFSARSIRVMPGFCLAPAVTTTTCAPSQTLMSSEPSIVAIGANSSP